MSIVVILVFAGTLRWLPSGGYVPITEDPVQHLKGMILPAFALCFSAAGLLARLVRSSMLDVLREDYVRTAWAKGLGHRAVVLRHALKNALIPFVTAVGLEFGGLLGGLVVVEQIFSWPGVGWLMIQSITHRDYAVVQGAVLLVATGFVVINLCVDVLYAYLDPRIRYR